MKVIGKYERQVKCPGCDATLAYDGRDLRTSAVGYCIECPICGEMIFFSRTKDLDAIYNETHDHWACAYMAEAFKDDRP